MRLIRPRVVGTVGLDLHLEDLLLRKRLAGCRPFAVLAQVHCPEQQLTLRWTQPRSVGLVERSQRCPHRAVPLTGAVLWCSPVV